MCDEGEKTCPLCAEEMDLTDQQLKPCKCGYEVCVWCWHHIMEMAEKDETEGRCPACRTSYDKEKIVGTTAKCERLVAEINMEKKMKSQKTKAKVTEVRKQQLSSVRVIQRNLVYIVGLPLNLADEDILQRKEYFGQYGKVLKVSMSRTAAGVIQQFPNNTCSVYITYSKEDEAIRCIQSVHGFTLDDRPLRACFGTTKYCHAWLRSVPCNNPDCLYLHEIGSQEDSFTKDEIISAYTRVQQITASTTAMQRRSGTVLPPPADNYCNGSSASAGKPIVKIPSNSAPSVVRDSPPNGSIGRSMGLPAAASWGTRGSNCSAQASNVEYPNGSSKSTSDPNGSSKSKSDLVIRTSASAGAAATEPPNLHVNVVKKLPLLKDGSHNTLANTKVDSSHVLNSEPSLSDKNHAQDGSAASADRQTSLPTSKEKVSGVTLSRVEVKVNITNERNIHNLCGDISSLSINRNLHPEPGAQRPETLVSDPHFIGSPENQGMQQQLCDDLHEETVAPVLARKVAPAVGEVYAKTTDKLGLMLSEVEEDILSFDNQRLKDPEVVSHSTYLPSLSSPHHLSNQFTSNSLQQHTNVFGDRRINDSSFLHPPTGLPNGHIGNPQSNSALLQRRMEASSHFPTNELQGRHIGISQGDAERNGGLDAGESNIISNILSMDFDPWNDSLTSPHNFAKMFGDTDRQQGSQKAPSPWKVQSSSQSRFSFARQEDSVSYPPNLDPPLSAGFEQMPRNKSIDCEKDLFFHKLGISNGFPSRYSVDPGNMMSSSHFAASRSPVVPRSQISAPPGFSAHSKAPPPGFSTTERVEHDSHSGNRFLDMPPLLRNGSETQMMNGSMGNTVGADIEFMDPAILAVGKGRPQGHSGGGYDIRSFQQQQQHILRPQFESDSRFDLLTNQRSPSISAHLQNQNQNQNHHHHLGVGGYDRGPGYSPLSDSSRVLDQSHSPLGNHHLPFAAFQQQQQSGRNAAAGVSNGHWNGWSDVQSGGGNGSMVMAELLRNERERLGINKQQLYTSSNSNNGFEDNTKYHRMPSSGDHHHHIYNHRTFGM